MLRISRVMAIANTPSLKASVRATPARPSGFSPLMGSPPPSSSRWIVGGRLPFTLRGATPPWRPAPMSTPAFLFDLDGTLVDSVYQHVLAWRDALEGAGIELSVWRIHRRIGMSGGLFLDALLRETGRTMTADETARVLRIHKEAFARQVGQVRPLPGPRALAVGLLSGGYGQEELERAGAYRVYQDPADLLRHVDEVGVRRGSSGDAG